MIRALKVALIVVGVIEILLGLSLVFVPGQAASGVSEVSGYLTYMMASLGICLIAFGAFLIVAARDPLRHINWVKYAIVLCILGAAGGLYSVILGAVSFGQAGMQIIMDAVIAAVFLALYPYRAAKGG
jgi:hypothetical protein